MNLPTLTPEMLRDALEKCSADIAREEQFRAAYSELEDACQAAAVEAAPGANWAIAFERLADIAKLWQAGSAEAVERLRQAEQNLRSMADSRIVVSSSKGIKF